MTIQTQIRPEAWASVVRSVGDNRFYTIGDMAREFSVSLRALRFYEDKGLISPRREGTSRIYDGRDRVRLQMILKGKQLGFTLAEVRELIGLGREPTAASLDLGLTSEQIKRQIRHLERQRSDMDEAVSELRAALARLQNADKAEAAAG